MASRKEMDTTVIRPRDLLINYLTFQNLTPNRLHWNLTALADNPPRLI